MAESFIKFKGFGSLSNLTFTPTWRSDYKQLYKERLIMYLIFLSTKLIFHPLKMLRQVINFFRQRFDTKMEMVPYKVLKLRSFENAKKMESNFIVKPTFRARPVTLSTPADSSRRGLCAEGYNVAVRSLKRLQNFILLFIFCIFEYFSKKIVFLKNQ